ncbi:MAG: ABC transporter substrate-binding protein [Desulfovibrionales bacterium]|nr:ABC transporter substrate-binding protein [Desulfovibrionales bacterium]
MDKLRVVALSLLLALFSMTLAWADSGHQLKVYGATFPSNYALYVLDPELLAGWNGPLRDYEKKFIPEKYQQLPVLGGWYGAGMIPDKEVLIQAGFDKAFVLVSGKQQTHESLQELEKLGFDVLALPDVFLQDSVSSFQALGQDLGVPERGAALGEYGQQAMAKVADSLKDLPENAYVRVYFAQDVDGLTTICAHSSRSDVITLAGGINVHQCSAGMDEGVIKISFEQIMHYDPDVILINHPSCMHNFSRDSRWQALRAVRQGQVYFVPYEPFSWLDRPASFMRFLGLQWLANTLHPDRFSIDMEEETDRFLRLFFRLDLSNDAIKKILNP